MTRKKPGPKPRPIADRFWVKVDKENGPVHKKLGRCWIWTGGTTEAGYGKIWGEDGKLDMAHRVSYKLEHGWDSIAPGNEIDHKCRTRLCQRPKHLESVTKEVNLDRRDDW